MTTGEMQFGGMLMTGLLTLSLAVRVPRKGVSGKVLDRSRLMMMTGTLLLTIQFLIQYLFHLRDEEDLTQAVLVNLLFFAPCSILISMGILYLQRQGQLKRKEWAFPVSAFVLMTVILLLSLLFDRLSAPSETSYVKTAEYACACIFCLLQGYLAWTNAEGFLRLHKMLNSYFDREMNSVLQWMERSVMLLSIIALLVPFIIFESGIFLLFFSILCFGTIYYCIISFICYSVSNAVRQLKQAEELDQEEEVSAMSLSEEEMQRLDNVVGRWIAEGGYLKSGLTIQKVANETHLTRSMLKAWISTTQQGLFNPWLTYLRLEEAKRILKNNPDWSNDTIAQACGFSSRSYFQTVFRKNMGMTPAQFCALYRKGEA